MSGHPRVTQDLSLATGQWINGQLRPGQGPARQMIDPALALTYAVVADATPAQADQALQSAHQALPAWRDTLPADRARLLTRLADMIIAKAEDLAQIEAVNVGKPLPQARRDVLRAAEYFRFYAGACDTLMGECLPAGPDQTVLTHPDPIGVTVHILPWNYPISTLARGVAPALAAGATAVAKPSELTPFSAVFVARLALQAGLPDGILNGVTGEGTVGAALCCHPLVDHVTFTGSTATGRRVMQAAASPVAGVTLELGGKSPVVVLGDADLDVAAAGVVKGIFFNAGQICAAGARLICTRAIHAALITKVITKAARLSMGHPLDAPDLGPLVNAAQLDRVSGFVERAKSAGLEPVMGGDPAAPPDCPKGSFYPPTLFADIPPDTEIARDEVFGPVLTSIVADDADQALAMANDSPFGLVAGIYTADHGTALHFARRLEAGQVFVNGFLSASDAVPFGGVKQSGIGREKGLAGLTTYLSPKSIILNHPVTP